MIVRNYEFNHLTGLSLYDGILELLEYNVHNGIKNYVATNKPERYSKSILQFLKIDVYFDQIIGFGTDGITNKTEMIKKCLTDTKINPNNVLMIGDSPSDFFASKNNGINFVGVKYGFGQLKNGIIVNTPADIINYVKKY